jgi:outer membrane protein TolC
VALTAGFGAQGTQGNTPPFRGPIWSAGPQAYWPLLDFGRLDALINIEEMRTHEELIRYRQTIMEAVEEVDQAIRQYHLDLQRSKALAAAQEDLRRAVGLMLERYRRGEEELPAVVGLQRWHHAHSEQAAAAAEGAVLHYIAFYKALGGGWELYTDLPPVPPVQPAVAASIRRLTSGWH